MPDNNKQDPALRNNFIKPWIALLFRPRLAMREILEKETAQSAWNLWVALTIVFAVSTPIIAYLQNAVRGTPTIPLKLWLLALPIAVIISFYIYFFESYLYWKISLWLGGHCEKSKMRIVFAWSATIPLLGFVLIDTIFSLLLVKENLLVLIADSIAAIWGFVIAIASIRELTNLSIWRAGMVWMSSYLIVMGGMLCILAIVVVLVK